MWLTCLLSHVGYTKERSSIIVIGLNIHTAPVEIREKLVIPETQWPQVIGELCALNHIQEAAVLSTCNRMEIYVVALSQHRGVKEVTEWMSKVLSCFMYNNSIILIYPSKENYSLFAFFMTIMVHENEMEELIVI